MALGPLVGSIGVGPTLRWRHRGNDLGRAYYSVYIWVNYNELTTSSLEIIVSKGNHPQMALIQVSELL